jgi:hypothetical protein
MPHAAVAFHPEKCSAGTHGADYGLFLTGQSQSAGAAGGELVYPAGGQTEDVAIHKAGTYAGQHDAAHILQRQTVAGQIVTQRTVEAGDLILGSNTQHGNHAAVCTQTYDFGGGTTDVDSENHGETSWSGSPQFFCQYIVIIGEQERKVNRKVENKAEVKRFSCIRWEICGKKSKSNCF